MANSASQIRPNALSAIDVYKLGLGASTGVSPGLEQKIAVMCEANSDMQTEGAQDGGVLLPIRSSEVADKFGYGSFAHLVAITLLDQLKVGVDVKFFFVAENGTATVTATVLTGTGAAITKTGTIVLNINGTTVSVGLVLGDTLEEALVKIKTAINAEINLPVLVSTAAPTTSVSIDSKIKGLSTAVLNISVDSLTAEGITFAAVKTDGTGETALTTALAKFQNDWFPHILNCVGEGTSDVNLDAFETFVGSASAGSGKYAPGNMTPAVAWTATDTSVLATLQAVTSSRLDYAVNCYVPLPNSQDIPCVNAANTLGIFVKKSNGDPKQDIKGDVIPSSTYPADLDVGDIKDPDFRDALVEDGCSTVECRDNNYYALDIITTYHPLGETDPVFRYVRDVMIDFNLINQLKAYNLEQKNKTIAPNAQPSPYITSPKLYKAGLLNKIIKPYVKDGYIADFDQAADAIDVAINSSNAGRFDTLLPVLITSLLRITATEVQVNKYYGS